MGSVYIYSYVYIQVRVCVCVFDSLVLNIPKEWEEIFILWTEGPGLVQHMYHLLSSVQSFTMNDGI